MLKRAFVSLLTLFALLAPLTAHAGKLQSRQIGFHSNLSAYGYSVGDSSITKRGPYGTGEMRIDTSQTIDIRKYVMPGNMANTTVASDTLAWLRFDYYPVGTAISVSADTAHVKLQVSEDDVNWTSVVWTGPKISPLVASMGALAALEDGTTNAFHWIIAQVVGGATQSVFNRLGTGAPTANQIYGFKHARVIVFGDNTGQYQLEVTGFVPDEE